MIRLINGRGQLGSALERLAGEGSFEGDFSIYHTWNFLDKSEAAQRRCYEEFKEFVDRNKGSKVFFISTYSQTENPYNHYKQLAEAYLINNLEGGRVIRLPTLIGKGICQKLKDDQAEPFGEMELMSIDDAAREILKFATSSPTIRSFSVPGTKVPATLVKDLILFGKKQYEQP